ncbi:YqaJ viral recombinase family protein [Streptomyces sp. T028]|uniref:YqaJ viral recombinase family nuclease n=1 Tax=Streptomyces sp. T028 TaxID=3394379 RepID=UPI003A89A18E
MTETSRPPFTSSTAASGTRAAVEAKAEEGQNRTAPLTRPAAGGSPTPCPASTSSAAERTGTEAKTEEERPSRAACAPMTPSAPDRAQAAGTATTPTAAVPAAGPEALVTASGPATPTARLLLPAGAPEDVWRTARQTGIGGSDIAALLGMDPHRGPLKVWLEKTGQAPADRDVRLERAARRGHRLEGLVAEFFEEESGLTVLDSPGTLQHIDHAHWIANPDRLVAAPGGGRDAFGIWEGKTRTWRSARLEGWHGDQAPDRPAIQAHWYLTVTGYRVGYVAGLIDDDLEWFRLERDEELCALLADAADRFWHEHVLTGIPPEADGLSATAELLARLWQAREEATVEVDPVEAMHLNQRRRELKDAIGALSGQLTTVENRMRQLAGDAEVATVGGKPVFTWRQNGQFAHARFRDEQPELAAQYTHLVPAVDAERLAEDHPQTYRTYRARVLRTPSEG